MARRPKTPAELIAAAKPKRHRPPTGKTNRKRSWTCELRNVRESVGLSFRDVAAGIEMTTACIREIEHGADPQLTTAKKIADFFGKTIQELWPARLE